jgi:tetratricopeptide (TPR) repeat protein
MDQPTPTHTLDRAIKSPSVESRRALFVLMSLLALCFIIYSNSLTVPFQFDDRANIVENEAIHMKSLNMDSISRALFSSEVSETRAIPMLTFALNWYFGKGNTYGYHIVNIAVHIITGFFLFLFLYTALRLPILKEQYMSESYSIAIIATLLWCVNPLQTQAVTYIVQRMAAMSTMFYIISMYLYLKGRLSNKYHHQALFFSFCTIFALMALFSKENAVTLPVALILLEVLLIRGLSKETFRNLRKPALIAILTVIVLAAGVILLQGRSVFSIFGGYGGRPFTLLERLLTQPRIICFYISLLLYPSPERLTIGHDIVLSRSLMDPYTTLPAILFIGGTISIALFSAKKQPLIAFSILFYFLNLAVESSAIALELIFEHRNYLPSMFFFVPIAILITKGMIFYNHRSFMRGIIAFFIVCLIIGQGYGVYARNFAWQTEEALWFDAIVKAPTQPRNHVNYAVRCIKNGQPEKALHHLQVAKTLGKHIRSSYAPHLESVMGDAYLELKQPEKAIHFYSKSILSSDRSITHNNMAMAYLRTGRLNSAQSHLIKSLTIAESAKAHANLGHVFIQKGKFKKAIVELKKAIQLDPTLIGVYLNLGNANKVLGHYKDSIKYYKTVIFKNDAKNPLDSKNIEAYLGLMEAYHLMGNELELERSADRFARLFISGFDVPLNLYGAVMNPTVLLSEIRDGYYRLADDIEKEGKAINERIEKLDGNSGG